MIPKHIFSYWHSDNHPEIVTKCMNTWKEKNPGFLITIYSEKKIIEEFKPLAEFYNLKVQNKADWARLQLLEKYGGVWLDATIFLHYPLSSWIEFDSQKLHIFKPPSFDVQNCDDAMFENWAIACDKNNPFIIEWNLLYSSFIKKGHLQFKIDMQKIQKYPKNKLMLPYFGMHLCSAILLKSNHFADEDIKIIESNDNVIEGIFSKCWMGTFLFKRPQYRLMTKISRVTRKIASVSNAIGLVLPNSEMGVIFNLSSNYNLLYIIIITIIVIKYTKIIINKK